MLWVFCTYFDSANAIIDTTATAPTDSCDVLWRFFAVLALWPWPLPFNVQNMDAIADRQPERVNSAALDGSIGRYLLTNVVVPLPSVGQGRFWNMTQAVTPANQRFITREAWIATMQRLPAAVVPNFREEMRSFSLTRHAGTGRLLVRWPLYLSVTFPADVPREWQGIVASRLMPTVIPQLERCGFIPRPLCCDHPAYILLIWPHDAVWSTKCHREIILPLGERLVPSIFSSLQSAYSVLIASSVGSPSLPPLERLLPILDLHLCDI